MLKVEVNVFQIHPSKPRTRVLIGSFDINNLSYAHSFGLTEDFIIILEQPVSMSMEGMMAGEDMMHDMALQKDQTTKIHVMKLCDGTV